MKQWAAACPVAMMMVPQRLLMSWRGMLLLAVVAM
jgi:hypothetical protein